MRRREDTGSGGREREKSLRDTGRSRGPWERSQKDIRRSGVGDPSKIERDRGEQEGDAPGAQGHIGRFKADTRDPRWKIK
jgi:hypothetical protein